MNFFFPNYISISRIILIVPIIFFLEPDGGNSNYISLILFLFAALTDFLDGYVARKMNLESDLGALLDLLADKLLIVISLIYFLTSFNSFYYLLPILLIVAREISISSLRQYISESTENIKTSPSKIGKFKTFSQILAVSFIILSYARPEFILLSLIILWVSAIISVYSILDYMQRWRKTK